eukprot:5768644-Heterocapsa_arctica.AAC.1
MCIRDSPRPEARGKGRKGNARATSNDKGAAQGAATILNSRVRSADDAQLQSEQRPVKKGSRAGASAANQACNGPDANTGNSGATRSGAA